MSSANLSSLLAFRRREHRSPQDLLPAWKSSDSDPTALSVRARSIRASPRRRELPDQSRRATPQFAFAILPALAVSSRGSRPSGGECRPVFRLEPPAATRRLSRRLLGEL